MSGSLKGCDWKVLAKNVRQVANDKMVQTGRARFMTEGIVNSIPS
jgi:hypothetical protein